MIQETIKEYFERQARRIAIQEQGTVEIMAIDGLDCRYRLSVGVDHFNGILREGGSVDDITWYPAAALHISKLIDKSARAIVQSDLQSDWYHENIWQSARVMVKRGLPHWIYGGQNSRGTTWWQNFITSESPGRPGYITVDVTVDNHLVKEK